MPMIDDRQHGDGYGHRAQGGAVPTPLTATVTFDQEPVVQIVKSLVSPDAPVGVGDRVGLSS